MCFIQPLGYLGRRLTNKETVYIKNIKSYINKNITQLKGDHVNTLKV